MLWSVVQGEPLVGDLAGAYRLGRASPIRDPFGIGWSVSAYRYHPYVRRFGERPRRQGDSGGRRAHHGISEEYSSHSSSYRE